MKNFEISLNLKQKFAEALKSVLPVAAIVLILSVTFVPLTPGPVVLFLFGALLLIVGMSFFTLGVDMSMIPMGEGIGASMAKSRSRIVPVLLCFLLGVLVTVAEPDLTVLANQVPAIENPVIILSVAAGVGLFLVLSLLRTALKLPLSYVLIFFYATAFIVTAFAPANFIPVSFDAGGVTTGPITVPFIMSLGIGLASVKNGKDAGSDSFGTVALCSVGPILSVLILGIVYNPGEVTPAEVVVPDIVTVQGRGKVLRLRVSRLLRGSHRRACAPSEFCSCFSS